MKLKDPDNQSNVNILKHHVMECFVDSGKINMQEMNVDFFTSKSLSSRRFFSKIVGIIYLSNAK